MNSQPKKYSLLESLINVFVGLTINITAQILIFPMFGIYIPISENLMIAGIFTIISILRSYALRRVFNFIHVKQHEKI